MMSTRINTIAEAATKLFLQQGYAKTQISHIAKRVGVSVGTIYLDFTGKKEIMQFILKCTIDPQFGEGEFERPITDKLFHNLEEEIVNLFEESSESFASHLNDSDYHLEVLISDAFDLLAKYAVGCLFIEKNYFDFPYLAQHYREYRKRFFQTMCQYFYFFMEKGEVRSLENPELTTTLIIEILSWWAMDMRFISFETQEIPLESAKAVCLDNIISAYKI